MHLTLLQFILIIASVVFFLFGVDLYKRKKATILHYIIFIGGAFVLIYFSIDVNGLNKFGELFGVARGADLLVYIAIIVLSYLYISMFNGNIKDKQELTRLISSMAIEQGYNCVAKQINEYKNTDFKDNFVLNIRVYNEATMLGSTIDEIIKAGFKKFVFINDGSKDNSQTILEQKKAKNPNCIFIILKHEINRGGGAANQTGYSFIQKYAKELKVSRFVGFDPDGQMDIQDMNTFIKEIKNDNGKFDAYLGSRFVEGASYENMPTMRKIILQMSKIITKILYGIKVSDPHNGYRVISIESLKKIHLTADGMHYANELNEQMKQNKFKTKEIPVNIRYTEYSLGKGQKNSNSIKLGLEMIYKKIFFR